MHFQIQKHKTALLVVDLQNDFTQPWGSAFYETTMRMMQGIGTKIDQMRELGALVVIIYTTDFSLANEEVKGVRKLCIAGTKGAEIDARIPYQANTDYLLQKNAFSAFFNTDLSSILLAHGVENTLVCGTKTNVCCRATAIDATSNGFKSYVIRDMVSADTQALSDYHLNEMDMYFAKALDAAEVLRRLETGAF